MGAFEGLAVPIAGAYTQTTASGTNTHYVDKYGFSYDVLTFTDTTEDLDGFANDKGWAEGISVQVFVNPSVAGVGVDAACFTIDHEAGTLSSQLYAAEFYTDATSAASVGSGQYCVINLTTNYTCGYGTAAHANAYIKFSELDAPCPNLFLLAGGGLSTVDTSGGIFYAATNSVIDHALRISVGSTYYYIGLYDALCSA